MASIGTWWMWLLFFAIIAIALMVDIVVFKGRKAHNVSLKEATVWTTVWIVLALLFNLCLWWYLSEGIHSPLAVKKALEFLTGYILEKSLSVDNIFVFLIIFHYFVIPPEYQRRVLLYGVIGAIAMRLVIIVFGIYLISKFHWILYIFGLILALTGVKMLFFSKREPDLGKNPILKWMRKHCKITTELHGERFFIRKNTILYATPLFLALVLIEISDLIFAIDSIPAVFAITKDSFIVFTSNIFAILGLRALYFVFAHMANRFRLLKYGVAIILVFIGLKMLAAYWFEIPVLITLSVIVGILLLSAILSIQKTKSSPLAKGG